MIVPRKVGILLAILIFIGFAGYFDVYDYLRFNTLSKKIDAELVRLFEYDKNVMAKRDYVDGLEKTIEPRIKLSEIKDLAQELGLSFSAQKDGTYTIQGESSSQIFSDMLCKILNSANVSIKSLVVTNNLKVPVEVFGINGKKTVTFKIVLAGVMLE